MRISHRAIGPVLAALLCAVIATPSEASTIGYGNAIDQGSFGAVIPTGFTGSSDFSACEFQRYANVDNDHYQHIYSDLNDTCGSHTNGAPSGGDVSIYQRFDVDPGLYYKGWATAKMFAPNNARATVKLIFRNANGGLGECYGRTESTSFATYHTGMYTLGLNGNPAPSVSYDGGCAAPSGSTEVAVHFRIHAVAAGASGKAVLTYLRFGRCWDGGGCGNVPSP